jgi:hypothetical protein
MESSAVESEAPRLNPATQPGENVPSAIEARLPLFDDLAERDRRIRLAAYCRYQARGCEPGHELDDWLAAEAEINGGGQSSETDFSYH